MTCKQQCDEEIKNKWTTNGLGTVHLIEINRRDNIAIYKV